MTDPVMPSAATLTPTADPAAGAFAAIEPVRRSWLQWLPPLVSIALAVAVIMRMRDIGLVGMWNAMPREPLFWIAFAAYYLALPGSEWIIYRRLWHLPLSGIVPLLRKLVSNELLVGYSGEAVFYLWARTHAKLVAAPFGAIKDVSILSALAGNAMTLMMLVLAWPLLSQLWPGGHAEVLATSAAVIVLMSVAILLFRVKLFSLPRRDLLFIYAVHSVRLIVTTLLTGLMLHVALPQLEFAWLIVLATLQLVVTRLPFVPNKDLVFANVAIFLVGADNAVAIAIATIAGALVLTHIAVGLCLVLSDVLRSFRR